MRTYILNATGADISPATVSYTHLDVYKRQHKHFARLTVLFFVLTLISGHMKK